MPKANSLLMVGTTPMVDSIPMVDPIPMENSIPMVDSISAVVDSILMVNLIPLLDMHQRPRTAYLWYSKLMASVYLLELHISV